MRKADAGGPGWHQDLCKRVTLDIFGKVSLSYDFGALEVGRARALGLPEAPKDGADVVDTFQSMMGPMFMLAMNLPLPDWTLPGFSPQISPASLHCALMATASPPALPMSCTHPPNTCS